jgi:hypothetical protein
MFHDPSRCSMDHGTWTMDHLKIQHRKLLFLACALAAFAYMPILNNGFIADDYVILKRIEILKNQPLYLYQVPPENFRFVSYLIFGFFKLLAGYQAWSFYAFNIALHVTNVILLWRLLRIIVDDEFTAQLAVLFFAVFQAPQEAVMWLAAMNETTLLFFTLLTLLAWSRKKYAAAALSYACALFSKESAVVVTLLALVLDLYTEKRFVWRRYIWLAIPTAAFAALFLATVSNNFMLTSRTYSFGPHALLVLGKSLHRLLWPWFYIVVVIAWFGTRKAPSWRKVAGYLGAVAVVMLPYIFIAYQTSIPSRQLYLASAVLMTMFAVLLRTIRDTSIFKLFVVVFIAFHVGYLWLRKDRQFEDRAAPTTRLVSVLKVYPQQRAVIRNFAYQLPEIATSAALAAGWDPSLISIGDTGADCHGCLLLDWKGPASGYAVTKRR